MASKRTHCDGSKDRNESTTTATAILKKKFTGSKINKVSFKNEWKASYPITEVKHDKYKFHCLPCGKNLTCHHQGLKDVREHCNKSSHKQADASWRKQTRLPSLYRVDTEDVFRNKVLNAEVTVTNFIVQHNLPIPTSDHLVQLFKNVFPDGKIAASYASAKTKTFAIINKAFEPYCHSFLADYCKSNPFSVGHDGSNDTGVQKMKPVAVRMFDIKNSKTVSEHFFSMCLNEEEDAGKVSKLFEAIEESFEADEIPWNNCASLSVDNTNAMIGKQNSVASRFLQENPDLFIGGCPCHLAHITASHANDVFSNAISTNVEDVCVDCFYWFDKSTKRKGKIVQYYEFCEQDYQSVLKHISVRWLSLERCIGRILKKYPGLKSYFLSERFADERFRRLNKWFNDPLLEPEFFSVKLEYQFLPTLIYFFNVKNRQFTYGKPLWNI